MLPKSAQKIFQGHLKSKSSSKNTPKMRNFEVQFCPWKCVFCHFHTFLALACVWRLALLWINVRWIALISEKILSTKKVTRKSVKKIFGVVWNQKIHRKTAKVWNFKSLLWAWKSGFCSFHTFRAALTCVWCVLWLWINVHSIAMISKNILPVSTKNITRRYM